MNTLIIEAGGPESQYSPTSPGRRDRDFEGREDMRFDRTQIASSLNSPGRDQADPALYETF